MNGSITPPGPPRLFHRLKMLIQGLIDVVQMSIPPAMRPVLRRARRWVAGACIVLTVPNVHAQTGAVIDHVPPPKAHISYFAYEDARGCVERVREPVAEWRTRAPAIFWSGECREGLRDGMGSFKLYEGRLLVVASGGGYVNGFRIGPWRWEFPDGRRLEAHFPGDGSEPIQRIVESVNGERQLQRLSAGAYLDEPGIAPAPTRSSASARGIVIKSAPGHGEAAAYAAAHFPVASCAGKGGIDPRVDLLATRRDVDRFVRDGEEAVRQEIADDIRMWSRGLVATMIRALAYAASSAAESNALRARAQATQDRLAWARCHQKSGLPYLARMLQAVPGCERASLFRLESVRESDNPRLQAQFADCLHADIHSARWGR